MWPNAFRVLERLGLGDEVLARAGRIERALWLDRGGTPYKQFAFPETGAPAVALHRADLQATLRRALSEGTLHLGKTFKGFDEEGEALRLRFADGTEAACDLLVGADGLHSRVRAQMLGDTGERGEPVYRGYSVWRGVTRLEHASLPAEYGVWKSTATGSASASGPWGPGAPAGGRLQTSLWGRRSRLRNTPRNCRVCSKAGARP